jgi:hypothetical protein
METVSSGVFIRHGVSGDNNGCNVIDILVHTDPGQDKPVIIIADMENNELRTFDLSSWQCVSHCTTPSISWCLYKQWCLYESDGDVYLHCCNGSLYNISSVRPLTISTSPNGHIPGVTCYYYISHLGPGRLVAVCPFPPAVHVIDLHGRTITDITTCGGYRFRMSRGVVCGGGRVVVTGKGFGSCLGREWEKEERVVCIEESAGSWSVQWMHDVVDGYTRTPVITSGGGTVIVPCGHPDRIVSLSLETGAGVQQVDVAQGCPKLRLGTCISGKSLLVGCGRAGVVEFSLQGKMVCHHVVVVVVCCCCYVCYHHHNHCQIKKCQMYL